MRSLRALSAESAAGWLIVVFGAWFLWQGFQFREGPGFAVVGPRVFPIIVGLGLLLSGLALAVLPHPPRESEFETDWRTLTLMAAALAVYVAVFLPLGFLLASVAFFVAGAWVLGSRAPLRDLVIGVALIVGVYLLFTRLLSIDLPAGPLSTLI